MMQETHIKGQTEKQPDHGVRSEATSSVCEAESLPEPAEANTRAATWPPASPEKRRFPGRRSWVVRAVPTAMVLILLTGIGYVGRHTGWKIPTFSTLVGNGPSEEEDWCEEHGVPESLCIACNATLMPKGRLHGWCKQHGVHECPSCHPEVAQLKQLPASWQADLDRVREALALKQRVKNDPSCKLHLRRIQFTSAEAAEKAGIDIRLVDRAPIVETASANGEITYDPTRVARLSSRAAGTVWRVEKNLGDTVHEGEVLALVDAAEVGRAKAELLQALARLDLQTKTYNRLANLDKILPGRRLEEAETFRAEAKIAVDRAIQALVNLGMPVTFEEVSSESADERAREIRFLGLPASITRGFNPSRTTSNLIPVTAPRQGVVVARDLVAGEVVDPSKTLFTVVDTRRMWLLLDVQLEDAQYVTVGQKVVFRPDGSRRETPGTITWVSTEVDRQTRTVKLRAELSNVDGRLRDKTFGAGRIVLREEHDATVVPNQAIHWEGCCHVVFVRDKDFFKDGSYKVFHTRSVRPGVKTSDYTELIAGVLPGEVVAARGSGTLRAELLKGNLGAG